MSSFERQWVEARELEGQGDLPAAIAKYEQILAAEPFRLYARLRVSTLLQKQGSYRRARDHALRAAEDVADERWADLHHVTRKLLMFDAQQRVLALIHGTDWQHRDIIGASPMLAQHLWLCGDVAGAIKMCEAGLSRAPEHLALNYAHGTALSYAGRLQEAEAAFNHCLKINPGDASAHWSLAYLGKSKTAVERLPVIEQALQADGTQAQDKPYLHYAAFKVLNDAGRHEEAWQQLIRGAAIKRGTLDFHADRQQEVFSLMQANAGRAQRESGAKVQGAIFIVGMPRTGTTLLERILGNHPLLAAGGELTDFRSALNNALDQFIGTDIDAETLFDARKLDLASIGRDYLHRTAWRLAENQKVLVDKHPENFQLSELIMDALPAAKILCMRRNPMDACFSNLKELFSNESYGYSYTLEELADHYAAFDALARHWQATRPDQFQIVDYETLVAQPVEEARRIFKFLGLAAEDRYADITLNQSSVTTASAAQVREPVTSANIGAWRAYAQPLEPLRQRLFQRMPASEHARIGAE